MANATIFMAKKYRCKVCDHVYDPAVGDPDNGIVAGTPFHELPEGWVCPVCKAGKDKFEGFLDDND